MRTDLETLCLHAFHHPGDEELQQIARHACRIAGAHEQIQDAWCRSRLAAVIEFVVVQVFSANADTHRVHCAMRSFLRLAMREIEDRGFGPLPATLAAAAER